VVATLLAAGAALAALAARAAPAAPGTNPALQPTGYRDGHTRPRALAFNADDGLLYVALSTADEVAIVDPAGPAPRLVARRPICRFPDAVVALPGGGALVACRFDAGLRRVVASRGRSRDVSVTVVDAGRESGARGLALAPGGAAAYVASPPTGGVKVVSLAAGGGVLQSLPTGMGPRALRVVPAGRLPGWSEPLLLVASFIEHTVTVHRIAADGRLGAALQTIRTEAPVLDLLVAGSGPGAALLLFTHEDRALSRAVGPVEGLDSGVLRLAARAAPAPFDDPGPGRRAFVNLGDRAKPVIELGAADIDMADGGAIAVVGAGTDNLLLADARGALATGLAVDVGANPSAVAALGGGRFVTADRLSDTLTFVAAGRVTATLAVGAPERPTPAERGELLFYSRALVPHNVAAGPLSLYTCAACHDDGHVDGRRHPSKRNRFFSMTESCRGLGTTAPYLSLGDQPTIEAFADNIVATHAQGAERDPAHFDRYPVTLRVRGGAGWGESTLSPEEVRTALASYMARIPPEPSPFVEAGRRALAPLERRGLALFRSGCAGCHQLVGNTSLGNAIPARALERRLVGGEVALTSPRRYAVGTPILGEGGNNPPSLRGVWDAAPYFSDGSARTLEEVLRRTDPDGPAVHAPENAARKGAFSDADRDALLAFLRAL
jgi:mono/diheme cytochrome c family protein